MAAWLIDLIKERGSISVSEYMDLCLYHPEYGYYTSKNPFKDFVTAPELSQLFGEMVGLCVIDVWQRMGSPRCSLIELGPGQGTLMSDLLRIAPQDFLEATDIHMVETSPKLVEKQRQKVKNAQWHDHLDQALAQCHDKPTFFIANEFFDALPIEQTVKTESGWIERRVAVQDGKLVFTPDGFVIKESCPPALEIIRLIAQHLQRHEGMALIIDYGYLVSGQGDTLQGLSASGYENVLSNPGGIDLTAHVDFEALSHVASQVGTLVCGPTTQGGFLTGLGIMIRAQQILARASEHEKQMILQALKRLIEPDQMGQLFKVMALCGPNTPQPEGFQTCIRAAS